MGILMEASERNLELGRYRRGGAEPQLFGAMGAGPFVSGAVHAIAINTRETEFGSIIEPVPITLDAYKQLQARAQRAPHQMVVAAAAAPAPVKEETKETKRVAIPPPKKKWIKEYLEEEPKSPVSVRVATGPPVPVRVNGVVRASPPPAPAPAAPAPDPPAPAAAAAPTLLLDFVQEHSRPRTNTNSHGGAQIPSPPSVGSSGSGSSGGGGGGAGRAGTREVHNKLEKNRRAHLKECFELLKRQLPQAHDDKKTSNLSILGSAIRYIQVLRRKERECEHEMERLAREKIAAQQRLAALRRDVPPRPARRKPASPPHAPATATEAVSKDNDESVNGQVLGIPISITSSPPPGAARAEASPPRSLNLSTKLRTLPVQISPTTSQVVRTTFARHSTLTLTALAAPAPAPPDHAHQTGLRAAEGALVHPAQIHLPLSPMVGGVSGGLVVGGALQLVGAPLRLLAHHQHQHQHTGVTTIENHRIPKENGVVSPPPPATERSGGGGCGGGAGGVVVGGLPLVVSQPRLLHPALAHHKVVESQVVKNGVAVSAQYLSTALVKPVVVVSAAAAAGALPPPAPAARARAGRRRRRALSGGGGRAGSSAEPGAPVRRTAR